MDICMEESMKIWRWWNRSKKNAGLLKIRVTLWFTWYHLVPIFICRLDVVWEASPMASESRRLMTFLMTYPAFFQILLKMLAYFLLDSDVWYHNFGAIYIYSDAGPIKTMLAQLFFADGTWSTSMVKFAGWTVSRWMDWIRPKQNPGWLSIVGRYSKIALFKNIPAIPKCPDELLASPFGIRDASFAHPLVVYPISIPHATWPSWPCLTCHDEIPKF